MVTSHNKNNMLTDAQRWQLHKWIESLGEDRAWKETSHDLAILFNSMGGTTVTTDNVQHARRVVFPRDRRPTRSLQSAVLALEERVSALEKAIL